MAQVEAPANLDHWPTREGRLITIILIRCGLRATDACTLPFDCLLHDGQRRPLPALLQQQDAPRGRRPDRRGTRSRHPRPAAAGAATAGPTAARTCFRAPHRNAAGQRTPLTYYSYRAMLNRWLSDLRCPRRTRPARPPHPAPVAAHLRLPADQPRRPPRSHPGPARSRIDRDDRPLRPDHRSDRPAALGSGDQGQHQRRTRHHRPRRAAGTGQWAKTRYGIATQTLPNGYCGLPLQKQLPARQRLPDLPSFPDRTGVPARTTRNSGGAP